MTLKRMRKLKFNHYYLVGLTVSDLLLVPVISVGVYIALAGGVSMTEYYCSLNGFSLAFPLSSTICIHCLMGVEKCVSVLKPLTYRRFVARADARRWVVAAIICCFMLPFVYIGTLWHSGILDFYYDHITCTCLPKWTITSYLAFGVITVIGLTAQIMSHMLIYRKIITMSKRRRKSTIKAARTLLLTVGLYYVCWLPYSIYILFQFFVDNIIVNEWGIYFSGNILMQNSYLNIFVYIFSLPGFKESLFGSRKIGVLC